MSTAGSFPVGKAAGREADQSSASIAEVKNAWGYTSTLSIVFMEWCLIKHRDNFTFTFTYLWWAMHPSQSLYLHRTTRHRKTLCHTHTTIGFRTHDSGVRAVKNVRALEHASTGTGAKPPHHLNNGLWTINNGTSYVWGDRFLPFISTPFGDSFNIPCPVDTDIPLRCWKLTWNLSPVSENCTYAENIYICFPFVREGGGLKLIWLYLLRFLCI
jgi:hypothetical protein